VGGRGPGAMKQGSALRVGVGVAARTAGGPLALKVSICVLVLLIGLLCVAGLFVASSPGAPTVGGEECRLLGSGSSEIPASYVPWLQKAALRYRLGPRGVSIVAAIHSVESDFGRSSLPGVRSGTNSAGAAGPGQFLLETWQAYGVDADGDGERDIYGVPDSVFATANYLHASGAPRDWHGAIFAYNHAEWYVQEVESKAEKLGGHVSCTPAAVPLLGGDADLRQAVTLTQPLAFKAIPSRYWLGGGESEVVDSRVWADVMWVLQTFDLRVVAAREAGHNTHGDGTAVDLIPAASQGWDTSARRAAETLGWRESCGASGTAPVCPLMPAIQFIGYNGYPLHGDPAHAGSNAHLHISWASSSFGCSGLCSPPSWVRVFPLSQ
jgi:Transglycosylase SLT domain